MVVVGYLGWHQTMSEQAPDVEKAMLNFASTGAGGKGYIKLLAEKAGECAKDNEDGSVRRKR